MASRDARHIEFMGWHVSIPPKDERLGIISEHDVLRIVLLAEDAMGAWCEFKCDDRLHAIKVAHAVREYKFGDIEVAARAERVYARSLK